MLARFAGRKIRHSKRRSGVWEVYVIGGLFVFFGVFVAYGVRNPNTKQAVFWKVVCVSAG